MPPGRPGPIWTNPTISRLIVDVDVDVDVDVVGDVVVDVVGDGDVVGVVAVDVIVNGRAPPAATFGGDAFLRQFGGAGCSRFPRKRHSPAPAHLARLRSVHGGRERGAVGPGSAAAAAGERRARQYREDYRTVLYLMLFRVVLASVLLLCAISLVLSQGDTESFGRAFARFLFGLLGLAYAVTLVYALVLPRVKHLVHFAYLQIGVDLVLIGALVHATGGAQSAFTILFMIQVIAVALLPERYGAAWVAAASTLLVILVSLAGYFRLLPSVPGQPVFAWELSASDTLFRLVLNVAAIATMGALGLNLSGQHQRAGERLARHQQYAGDLASLHQNTIRCLSSGLVTVTLEGHITSINEAACEILGIGQAGALGQRAVPPHPGTDEGPGGGGAHRGGPAARGRRHPPRRLGPQPGHLGRAAVRPHRPDHRPRAALLGSHRAAPDADPGRALGTAGFHRPPGRRHRPRDPQPPGQHLGLGGDAARRCPVPRARPVSWWTSLCVRWIA